MRAQKGIQLLGWAGLAAEADLEEGEGLFCVKFRAASRHCLFLHSNQIPTRHAAHSLASFAPLKACSFGDLCSPGPTGPRELRRGGNPGR